MAAQALRAPGLELRGVSKRFRDGARGTVSALEDASLSLTAGELVLLRGPSGAGKSTLLGVASGVVLPTEGEVCFEGERFSRLRESFRAAVRRERMGVLLQGLGLIGRMSTLENVLLGAVPDGAVHSAALARARALLATFGIEDLARSMVDVLSGGERQRVALARALWSTSALLLLDEPTAHLDAQHVGTLAEALQAHLERGGGVLLSTHDPRLEGRFPKARVVELVDGRLRG